MKKLFSILSLLFPLIAFADDSMEIHLVVNRSMDGSTYFKYLSDEVNKSLYVSNKDFDGSGSLDQFMSISIDLESATTIENLFNSIDFLKLKDLNNQLSADGSAWVLAAVRPNGEEIKVTVLNPSAARETPESKKLYQLGSYLWKISQVQGVPY